MKEAAHEAMNLGDIPLEGPDIIGIQLPCFLTRIRAGDFGYLQSAQLHATKRARTLLRSRHSHRLLGEE